MPKIKITARIVKLQPSNGTHNAYLRIEASDGMTYARVSELFRGKIRRSYSVWPTDSREIDVKIAPGRMPRAVRELMVETSVTRMKDGVSGDYLQGLRNALVILRESPLRFSFGSAARYSP